MNVGYKPSALFLGFICLSLFATLECSAQEGASIRGKVMVEVGGKFVEPDAKLKICLEGPTGKPPFTRYTSTKGDFNIAVNDLGWWRVTAKKTNYTQKIPRPVKVEVREKKPHTTDPEQLELEQNRGALSPPPREKEQVAAFVVLILYQDSRAVPAAAPAPATPRVCKDNVRRGIVVTPPPAPTPSPAPAGASAEPSPSPTPAPNQPIPYVEFEVAVNDKATGEFKKHFPVKTKADGTFEFELPPGDWYDEYLITIKDDRFEPYTLYLDRDECLPREIVLLPLTVETEEAGTLAEVIEATRRTAFSPTVMEALPIPGVRNFDAFALLAPGVLPAPESLTPIGPGVSPGLGLPGQFSINGLRSRENNYTIDGSDNNDEDIGTRRQGFVNVTPQPIESLQEFQVVTAVGDSLFGRSLGGQLNAVTKSGTGEFHGSLFGYLTDDGLNARNFFDQGPKAVRPHSCSDAPATTRRSYSTGSRYHPRMTRVAKTS